MIPTTINICVAQTLAAGGNMGIVIFNAILGNLLGVVLTPLLAVLILGAGQVYTQKLYHFYKYPITSWVGCRVYLSPPHLAN